MNTNVNLLTNNQDPTDLTIGEWLSKSTDFLSGKSIETARLDCLILLEDATGKDRSWLLAHPEFLLLGHSLEQLEVSVVCRAGNEPLAYIRGKCEFYGREFLVNKNTLVPRPESETIIDLLLKITRAQFPSLLEVKPLLGEREVICWDVGCGSGCLGATAKLTVPKLKVIGGDVDDECLVVARQNAQKLGADVEFVNNDLLSGFSANLPTIVLANLPYVPEDYVLNAAAKHEPKLAIFGGKDGLDLYRKLFEQARSLPNILFVITESLEFQHPKLAEIALQNGYKMVESKDLVQVFEQQD